MKTAPVPKMRKLLETWKQLWPSVWPIMLPSGPLSRAFPGNGGAEKK
jgi:hypothetical protein